jgi:hypothetical protein
MTIYSNLQRGLLRYKLLMSMTRDLDRFVEMMLLVRIFAVVYPVV